MTPMTIEEMNNKIDEYEQAIAELDILVFNGQMTLPEAVFKIDALTICIEELQTSINMSYTAQKHWGFHVVDDYEWDDNAE